MALREINGATSEGVPMDEMNRQHLTEREAQRVQANREELVERIGRAIREDGTTQLLQGLHLYRHSSPLQLAQGVVEPSVCVTAQGSKEVLVGDRCCRYNASQYLLVPVELPYVVQIFEASQARPFLGLRLELTPALVGSVLIEADHSLPSCHVDGGTIIVSQLDMYLLEAAVRLVRLLDSPVEASVLLPLITREIIYRLLMGEQSGRLRYIATLAGYTSYIARAVERLRQDFDHPLRMEQIACELGMSISSFHHHFKAVTGISPLQFQKRLRLQEARRLMLGEDLDASSAAYRVGYRDASHFNREYKSLFGVPPMHDVQRLREAARESADQ